MLPVTRISSSRSTLTSRKKLTFKHNRRRPIDFDFLNPNIIKPLIIPSIIRDVPQEAYPCGMHRVPILLDMPELPCLRCVVDGGAWLESDKPAFGGVDG